MNVFSDISLQEAQTSTWFSDWFDSPYYHWLYKNRDDEEAQFFVDNLSQKLGFVPQHALLDVACGKGRHAKYLNSKGLEVTGLDLSRESITEANTFQNERLRFFVQDMRHTFAHEQFDFVLNLFTSFGYFETEQENQLAIQAMANALKKGGKLVMDFFNPHKVIRELLPFETKQIDEIVFHITKKVQDQFIIKQIDFEHLGQPFHFQEKVKAIELPTFEGYFSQAGLQLLHTFGNYALSPYSAQESDRMILVAQKG